MASSSIEVHEEPVYKIQSHKNYFELFTSWSGVVASIMSLVLGITHIIHMSHIIASDKNNPNRIKLKWPEYGILDDVQKFDWRIPLFSFVPDMLAERWGPLILGILGLLAHLSSFNIRRTIGGNYLRFGLWHSFVALWGNIGFEGGLGIIISVFPMLTALCSFISYLMDNREPATLARRSEEDVYGTDVGKVLVVQKPKTPPVVPPPEQKTPPSAPEKKESVPQAQKTPPLAQPIAAPAPEKAPLDTVPPSPLPPTDAAPTNPNPPEQLAKPVVGADEATSEALADPKPADPLPSPALDAQITDDVAVPVKNDV